MIIMSLVALTLSGVTYAGEVADDFGAETIEGNGTKGYTFLHNNNNKPVWAALITEANITEKNGAAAKVEVVMVPAKPTLHKPGMSALENFAITGNKENTLAIWSSNPGKVTMSKGIFGRLLGLTITPRPVITYTVNLPKGKNQLFLELNGERITEEKQ